MDVFQKQKTKNGNGGIRAVFFFVVPRKSALLVSISSVEVG